MVHAAHEDEDKETVGIEVSISGNVETVPFSKDHRDLADPVSDVSWDLIPVSCSTLPTKFLATLYIVTGTDLESYQKILVITKVP